MITPLMHILSCINEKYEMDAPLNILYLGNHDRDLIIKEAKRLSSIFSNENKIYMGESDIGVECVMESQEVAGEIISLSKYTALLLNRIAQCCKVYVNNLDVNTPTVREEDLSEDAVVLRLEVNPFFIYPYVFNVMETPSLTYNAKIAKLQELPGVGRKTANVVMSVGFNVPAIAVDTHVFRVSNRLKLSEGDTPLAVEQGLMKVIPKDKWSAAHHWLIWHGRNVCKARKPLCDRCPLVNVCPAATDLKPSL